MKALIFECFLVYCVNDVKTGHLSAALGLASFFPLVMNSQDEFVLPETELQHREWTETDQDFCFANRLDLFLVALVWLCFRNLVP